MTDTNTTFSWVALTGVAIVALLIATGLYYLAETMPTPEPIAEQRALEELSTQGDSTEPSAIEADLEAGSPDEFDAEFDQSMAELDAALQ